jgi:hypothetical protein
MSRLQLLTLILAFSLFSAWMVTAQQSQTEQREIYTALAYGEEVFEPDIWLASAAERADRTVAQWDAADLNAVAYVEYLHFTDGIERDAVDDFFNDEWFKVTLVNYESWERSATCTIGLTHLDEFAVKFEGKPYTMRYWTQSVSETRVLALSLVFPAEDQESLDMYAKRLFPDAADCPR